ncbi:hypothetical protein GCM10009603_05170 [Nocardiopsis exhalans]
MGSSYDELKSKQSELIRKMLDGSVFLAPISAPHIETLTSPEDGLLEPPPEDYGDLGHLSGDGAQFTAETETSDVTSWGSVEPTRSDIVSDSTQLQVTAQETNLRTIGLYTGVSMDAIRASRSGEVVIDKPTRPSPRYYRALVLGVDLGDEGEIYIARHLPRCKVTAKEQQSFQSGDDPFSWPVTLTGFTDSSLGFSERWFFGGPGWAALLEKMGIPRDGESPSL